MSTNPFQPPLEVNDERLEKPQWTWQWGVLIIGGIVVIVALALLLPYMPAAL